MAIFGFGKDKGGEDAALLVLAYMEDALRQRSPFVIKGPAKHDIAATLHSVSEDARTFRLLPEVPFKMEKGGKVDFTLIHDGLRLGATTRAAETREGVVVLHFPETLALMERRRLPRARLNPKENASLTALQDIFEGVGITSSLENVSEGGARVRVEKAIAISSQKPMVMGTNLVTPGQAFMVLKLNNLPKSAPSLETKGRAIYLSHGPGSLVMGFAFDKPPQAVEAALRRLVAGRAKPIPDAIPPKVRRIKEPEKEEVPEPPVKLPEAPVAAAPAVAATPESPLIPAAKDLVGEAVIITGRERRTQPRLSLGQGFQARFQAGANLVFDADLLDVSVGGCCLRLPPAGCTELQSGALLEEFHFLHRDLPNGVLQARVSWILGKNAAERPGSSEGRYCLVGIEFTGPSPEIVEGLEAYIAWHIEIPQ